MGSMQTRLVRCGATTLFVASLAACAASPKMPATSQEAPGSYGYGQQGAYPQQQPYPGQSPAQSGTATESPAQQPATGGFAPAPPSKEPPAPPPASPSGAAGGTSNRSLAIAGASSELDSSQRELDVAAGDCRNACRALGSMDRAAGRLCELAQGNDEGRRCDDAKKRVYSARDRVKSTCGGCPGGPSVERRDPIPSLR